MSDRKEEIIVVIGQQKFSGWKSVSIHISQEHAAMTFDLKVSEPAWGSSSIIPFLDETIEIYASGDLVMKAVIDTYSADAEGDKHEVSISGRSKGADSIESHVIHPTGRIKNQPLHTALNEYAKSTGLDLKFQTDVDLKPIPKIQIQPGDSVFAVAEREARKQGLLIEAKPDGSINLTRPTGKRHAGILVQGQAPLVGASVRFGRGHLKKKIVVRGQRSGATEGKELRQEQTVIDDSVKRNTTEIIHVEGDCTDAELKKRGEWHAGRQHGKNNGFTPRVDVWRDQAGKLWTPGLLQACEAAIWHINGDMLLQSVELTQDLEQGTMAVLTLVDPRAHGGKKPVGKTTTPFAAPEFKEAGASSLTGVA